MLLEQQLPLPKRVEHVIPGELEQLEALELSWLRAGNEAPHQRADLRMI